MLAAEGTDEEKAVTEAYLQELSEDVLSVDALIGFASSEKGAEVFGAEQAKSMVENTAFVLHAAQAERFLIKRMN